MGIFILKIYLDIVRTFFLYFTYVTIQRKYYIEQKKKGLVYYEINLLKLMDQNELKEKKKKKRCNLNHQ